MKKKEAVIQAEFIKMTNEHRHEYPELWKWLFHVPNGEKRDAFTGGQLKAMGVKKGVPDIIALIRRGDCPGVMGEFKAEDGKETPEQEAWLEHAKQQGWAVATWRSAQEAWDYFMQYLARNDQGGPASDLNQVC